MWEGTDLVHSNSLGIGDISSDLHLKVDTANGRWFAFGYGDAKYFAALPEPNLSSPSDLRETELNH